MSNKFYAITLVVWPYANFHLTDFFFDVLTFRSQKPYKQATPGGH